MVRAPGMSALKVCLNKSGSKVDGVGVWFWSGSALDEGEEAAQWFSSYLGKAARLVRFDVGEYSLSFYCSRKLMELSILSCI